MTIYTAAALQGLLSNETWLVQVHDKCEDAEEVLEHISKTAIAHAAAIVKLEASGSREEALRITLADIETHSRKH
tara:strand:+ start:630 stop:854 length:225 start_codon:yes stop_codon:yes gene_type:complete